jgi:iron(III) transport system substrate-binding protein
MRPAAVATAIGVAALFASLLAACGSSPSDTIVVYSGQHEQTTSRLVARFEARYHIKVEVRTGDEASLGQQVLVEGANSPADVFYSENTPVLESLREHGRLAPLPESTLAAVPRRYTAAQGDWVGVSARVSALVYNPSRLGSTRLPSSVLELGAARFRGKLAFAPAETDFQPLVAAIARVDGTTRAERWLRELQAAGTVYPDNETVTTQVNNGQSALGPIDHYYWYRLRAELGASGIHSTLRYFPPGDPGNLLDVSGAAILSSSSHRAAAQQFLSFLVSAEGQQTIAHSASYEYPLRAGVAPAPGLVPLAEIRPTELAPAALGDGSAALALEQKVGLL